MTLAKALAAAAGNAGEALFVDSVFSTWLYTGNGSTQTITNNVDLAGEGGLVWIKGRAVTSHRLFDSTRALDFSLSSNTTGAQEEINNGNPLTFNSNGFSLPNSSDVNTNTNTYVSWTFRKAAKFFDVVTYTGNGATGRNISHALGSVPGFVVVKLTSTTGNWNCIHRQNGSSWTALQLNSTAAGGSPAASVWGDGVSFIAPTSANFTVGSVANNTNGQTYVAYLFAHDAGGFGADGSENVISCGSYVEGSSDVSVTLGYEPAWILVKPTSTSGNWNVYDVMRGAALTGNTAILRPNTSDAEVNAGNYWYPTSTGFIARPGNFGSGVNMIYIAIRRPMKPPESGTGVFGAQTWTGGSTTFNTFPADLATRFTRTANYSGWKLWGSRLQGQAYLNSINTNSETADTIFTWNAANNGTTVTFGATDSLVNYYMRRAPGFFDVVCYTGTGVARTVAHNLTVAPELMIVKERSGADTWKVYVSYLTAAYALSLNETVQKELQGASLWNSTDPTSSVFSLGTGNASNANNNTFVAYLFASYPGVSKVGSYTGTGTTQQINCGFTSGSRFVLIKRTDSTGDWYVWDSARGIVAGNDPYLLLNSTAAEVTNTDYIDTYSAGFEISSTAPAAINANGGSFIYLSIA